MGEKTPEELAAELDSSFEDSKARAEKREESKEAPAKIPDKPKFGSGSDTTDDGTGSRW